MRPLRPSILAALAACALAPAQEAAEPNDTVATASAVTCPGQAYGHLAASGGDHDLWRFQLVADALVTIYTTSRGAVPARSGGSSAEDTRIDLYGAGGPDGLPPLASNDDHDLAPFEKAGFFSKIEIALAAGTYFLDVYGFSAVAEWGDYAIDLACRPVPPVPTFGPFCTQLVASLEVEPNDTAGTAGAIACCRAVSGFVTPADEDWFALTLAADSRCVLEVSDDPSAGPGIDDPEVLVFDAAGIVLLGADDDGGPGLFSRLVIDLPAGTWTICVRHALAGGSGAYRLRIDCGPSDRPLALRVPADFAVAGTSAGCPGSSGVPLTMAPRANEWPLQDSTFTTDIAGVATVAVVLLDAFTFEPPIDLALIGAPACFLAVDSVFPAFPASATVSGEAEFGLELAFTVDALGARIHLQAASVDPGANALGVTLSDRLTLTLGNDA